jgi:hypothetical protein
VDFLPRDPTSNFDKAALIDDLKRAGFEESLSKIIADHVEHVKDSNWTYDMGRQQAIKEAQTLIDASHLALDRFREEALPSQTKTRPFAERISDNVIM